MQHLARRRAFGPPLLLAAAVAAFATPAVANDSSAELSLGGLTFTRSAEISMESETLTITPETVTVRYQFLNQSQSPVTLTVAFPLPDIDLADADNIAIPNADPVNFVGFETKVDGSAVSFTMDQRAFVGTNDVSALLRELGLPLLPLDNLKDKIAALPAAARTRLIDQGLLVQSGQTERGQPLYDPGWKVKTSAVRQQTFPPGRPVAVEHRYRTSLGGSVDTVLRKALRQDPAMANEVARYRREFCVTDRFLADLDKLAGPGEANTAKVQERRISYVLKTGANWAGPIKQFHLVVDAGKPDRLVSFCSAGVRRASPTTYEVTATNFTPDRDLKILILGRF
jgi:hypothetical protein